MDIGLNIPESLTFYLGCDAVDCVAEGSDADGCVAVDCVAGGSDADGCVADGSDIDG